jgi:hypothetical protein
VPDEKIGPFETALRKSFTEDRIVELARQRVEANSYEWVRGFMAAADVIVEQVAVACRHCDQQVEKLSRMSMSLSPHAMRFSAERVRSYGTTLDLERVADLVAEATGVDRSLLDWVTVSGKPELWIAIPE